MSALAGSGMHPRQVVPPLLMGIREVLTWMEVLEESVGEGHPRERKLSAKVWRLENINGKLAIDDWGREQ